MSGKLYTQEEVVLCTYAALYNAEDFGGLLIIQKLQGRSLASIIMKVGNIAAMLDEKGITRHNNVKALSGKPRGERGRRTNWEWVKQLVPVDRKTLLLRCQYLQTNSSMERV